MSYASAPLALQDRLRKEVDARRAERVALERRSVAMQAEALRAEARLEQFRLLMSWNADELQQWALAHAQKEDDNLALEKYRRQVP